MNRVTPISSRALPPPSRSTLHRPTDQLEEIPPNDHAAEAGALGAMLCDVRAARLGLELLQREDYYQERHRILHELFREVYARDQALDLLTVMAEARRRGLAWGEEAIGSLVESTPGAAGIERYCRLVKDRALERKALVIAREIILKARAGAGQAIAEEVRSRVDALRGHQDLTEPGTMDGIGQQIEDEISGRRYAVEWTGCPYLSKTMALLPGTISIFCGSAGASKSLFILEHVWRWYFAKENVSLLELEKSANFHRRRAVAQMAERQELTNFRWCMEHPHEAREILAMNQPALDALMDARTIQAPLPGARITREFILRWMRQEADAGRRVVCVDPISKLVGGEKLYRDQEALIDNMAKLAESCGLSVVLVTHPRAGRPGSPCTPHLDNMQGSKSFERFVDNAFWLESHKPDEATVTVSAGRADAEYNRTLHCLKVRNAAMGGEKIAYQMDGRRLWHVEKGLLS